MSLVFGGLYIKTLRLVYFCKMPMTFNFMIGLVFVVDIYTALLQSILRVTFVDHSAMSFLLYFPPPVCDQ